MKTYLLDTNMFIRYLIQDVPHQFEKARKIFTEVEENQTKGLVSLLVVNETIWILEHYYELKRQVYIPQFKQLLALKHLKCIEVNKLFIMDILTLMLTSPLDFTDIYLVKTVGKHRLQTFDKVLLRFSQTVKQ